MSNPDENNGDGTDTANSLIEPVGELATAGNNGVPPSEEVVAHEQEQAPPPPGPTPRGLSGSPRPPGMRAWQQQALARCQLLRAQWVLAGEYATHDEIAAREAAEGEFLALLDDAETCCGTRRSSPIALMTGLGVERVWANVHTAEVVLLEALLRKAVAGYRNWVLDEARADLPANSPLLRAITHRDAARPLTGRDLAAVLRTAHSASTANHVRVRSFRNILYWASVVVVLAVAALALVGALAPNAIPMCNTAATQCLVAGSSNPEGHHVAIAAVIGAAAGILAGVASLGRLKGSSVPYSLSFALGLFKGPCGALSAILGLLVIRSGIAGDDLGTGTAAGIVGWVIVFGASQQLVTRIADQKGQTILEGVRSGTGNKPKTDPGDSDSGG